MNRCLVLLSRAFFRVVFTVLCGLRSFKCGLGMLNVWPTFSLLFASCFAVFLLIVIVMFHIKFKNSTTRASMWHQATKGST